MRTTFHASTLLAACVLAACTTTTNTSENGTVSSSSSSELSSSARETHNVTYSGTVEPAGISIYQEGTHRLTLDGAKFILLESDSLDLNGYVGEHVQVFGSLRPTVEAGGMIMRVERIVLLNSSSSVSSFSSDASSSSSSELASTQFSSSSSSSIRSSVSSGESSSALTKDDPAFEERTALMASDDLASANWTQKYCTGHIEFCIPVHKNWWFKSFGTTTTYLWHVEISTEDIQTIGDGPISVNLLSGTPPASDGTVRTEGGVAVGYRSWSEGRYFVIKGESSLLEAVRYITQNLQGYSGE